MSVIAYNSQETEVTSSSVGWTDVVTIDHDFDQDSAEYFLSGQAEFWATDADKGISLRVLIDDVDRARVAKLPRDSGERFLFAPMGRFTFTAGNHVLKLQMAVDNASQTVHVEHARLRVDKK